MGNRCQWKLIEREVRHEIQSISFWARKIFVFSSKLKQEIHFIKINLLKSFQAKKKTSHRLNCEIIIRVFGLALLLHKFRSVARNRTLNMQNCLECCHPQTQFSVCSHPAYAISFHFIFFYRQFCGALTHLSAFAKYVLFDICCSKVDCERSSFNENFHKLKLWMLDFL